MSTVHCPQLKSDGSGDLLTEAILELGEEFPAFTEVLIGERDRWLSQQLFSCARNDVLQQPVTLPDGTEGKAPPWPQRVVAVVGAGHIPGMKKYWQDAAVQQGARTDLAASFVEFPPRKWDRAQRWLIGGAAIASSCLAVWAYTRSYRPWAAQATTFQCRLSYMSAAAAVGSCCFSSASEDELERLRKRARKKQERGAKGSQGDAAV